MKIQKNQFFSLLFLFIRTFCVCTGKKFTKGKVMYRDSNVINENVLNVTAELATITNEDGQFEIMVALGDELIFYSC